MNTPTIGDNAPQAIDYAAQETARLQLDYGYLPKAVDELLNDAAKFEIISDAEDKAKVMSLIKRIRDEDKRITGLHEIEKMPHLRRGQAADSFFKRLTDLLVKPDRKAKDGAKDRLERILTDYDLRELAKEEERRRAAALEAARIAREKAEAEAKAAREAAEAARIAEEARLAAERARKPETQAAKTETAHEAVLAAQEAADALSATRVDTIAAAAQAEQAYIDTLMAPADIMRTRTADALGTMGTEKFAEITDRKILDLEKLRPYLPVAALETALRKYAESCGYSSDETVQIAGARFGKKKKSQVR